MAVPAMPDPTPSRRRHTEHEDIIAAIRAGEAGE